MADKKLESIQDVQVGDFIKLVDRDKQGRFTYTGEVLEVHLGKEVKINNRDKELQGAGFTMLTFEGIMGFDMCDPEANELYKTTVKPKGWEKFKKGQVKAPKKKPVEISVKDVKSKKEQVLELVKNNPRKKEKSLLDLARKEIGGTDSVLSNYIKLALAKK